MPDQDQMMEILFNRFAEEVLPLQNECTRLVGEMREAVQEKNKLRLKKASVQLGCRMSDLLERREQFCMFMQLFGLCQ